MFTKETSLIVPTRNRPDHLRNLLTQLKNKNFNEIIVVDSSDKINKLQINNICKLDFVKLYHSYPSTSHQRNIGLSKAKKKNKFIMFADDDVIFLKNSFMQMNKAINLYRNNLDVGGFGFNLIDSNSTNHLNYLKKSWLAQKLNLYSKQEGKVTKSGWHTKIVNLKSNKFVDWIYTGAAVYKHNLIKDIRFDNNLGDYSYLEDLDFCLTLKKNFIIASNAKFTHPNNIERINFNFGIIEIVNRYILVRKHKLSIFSFFLGSLLRFSISFLLIYTKNYKFFFRSIGNIIGILQCILFFILGRSFVNKN